MNSMQHLRWASLGIMLGALIALAPGCVKKCAPDNCSGCCNAKNECVGIISDGACGSNGAACGTCSDTQTCQAGACVAKNVNNNDGGLLADGGLPDGGQVMVDAGPPPCKFDLDCRVFANGSTCDTSSGKCVPGVGCAQNYECQSSDSTDKCYQNGQQCFCDLNDGTNGLPGTCRLRRGACEECKTDRECGDDEIIFGPPGGIGSAKCAQLMGDTSGKKYCLYRREGQCACGTVDDGTGYCKPQGNSCSQVGCNVDKDCSAGSVCSVNQPDAGANSCGGICVPRCKWDFRTGTETAPGCGPGTTCWVDSANLDPQSAYYGAGRCKPPCQNDPDCKAGPGNPFGGNNLKCAGEKLVGGGMSPKRCRAAGDCMDNLECPELPNDQPYLGYCDRRTFGCKQDCRVGADPVSNLPYTDCRSPYACGADGGVGLCRLQNCMEQGGAATACSSNEYCCGEDANRDGRADPCPPVTERNAVGCYKAPAPPFCTACMSDDECKNPTLPAWLSGPNACRDGEKNPACSPLPNKCLYAGDRGQGMMGVSICAPATWNDTAVLENNKNRARLGCPVNYALTWVRPAVNATQTDYCQSNADCNLGTDAGSCETDSELRLQDGGFGKSCRCTAGTRRAQCPNGTDGGVVSECRSGVAGQRTICIESVVCMPANGRAYQPVANYGCGL